MITTNIRIDPVYIVDHNLVWHYELPFRENVDAIVKEYKIYRNLLPIKVRNIKLNSFSLPAM